MQHILDYVMQLQYCKIHALSLHLEHSATCRLLSSGVWHHVHWWPNYLLVCGMGVKKQSVNIGTLHRHHPAFCVRFKNIHCDWSYKCTPSTVNVFERGITLPGCSKVSLAVTSLYWLQLCVVLGGWDSNLPGHYCTGFGSSASNLSSHCYTPAQKCGFCCGETFEQHSSCLADEENQWLLTLVYSHVIQAFLLLHVFRTQCIHKQASHMRKTEQNTETCIAKGTTYKHTKKITNFNARYNFHSHTEHLDIIKVFLFTNWCTRELL